MRLEMNKFYNFLGIIKRSGNLIEGYSKCNEQRNRQRLYLFIISPDASESTQKKFVKHCESNDIPYINDLSKTELGDALGRPEVMILGVVDSNMAKKLLTIYQEEKSMN